MRRLQASDEGDDSADATNGECDLFDMFSANSVSARTATQELLDGHYNYASCSSSGFVDFHHDLKSHEAGLTFDVEDLGDTNSQTRLEVYMYR